MIRKFFHVGIFVCWMILLLAFQAFGSSEVGADGAFNYSIPLNLPPATAGMGPSLSLAYNSEAGNGLVGVGWQLQGYDVISRDFRYPVSLSDSSDHFVFMGQRLFKDSSTGYYHTENESFMRIEMCSGGPNGNGIYWKVTDKNGVVKFYGSRAAGNGLSAGGGYIFSHSSASNDPARVWALDKVMDVYGNYYTFNYMQNQLVIANPPQNVPGWYPDSIVYTKNDSNSFNKYRVVQFAYEDRPDSLADSKPTQTAFVKRLIRISVFTNASSDGTGGTLHHYYNLTYNQNLVDTCNRSILATFQEVGSDSATTRPPLRFSYTPNHQISIASVATPVLTGHSSKSSPVIITNADFDGDGKDDIMVYKGNKTVRIYFAKAPQGGSCFQNYLDIAPPTTPYSWIDANNGVLYDMKSVIRFGDFNGDGRMDFMFCAGWPGTVYVHSRWWVYVSLPGSTTCQYLNPMLVDLGNVAINEFGGTLNPNLLCIGDINGDGKSDIVSLCSQNASGYAEPTSSGKLFLAKADGTGFNADYSTSGFLNFYPPYYHPATGWGLCYKFSPEFFHMDDFNGDGRMDFLIYCKINSTDSSYAWSLVLANTNATFNTNTPFQISQDWMDFGTLQYMAGGSPNGGLPQLYFHDFNGDGKTDVLSHLITRNPQAPPCSSEWTLFIADPASRQFASPATNPAVATFYTEDVPSLSPNLFGDFNGDGMTDILICHSLTWLNPPLAPPDNALYFTPYLCSGSTMIPQAVVTLNEWEGTNLGNVSSNVILGDFDGNGLTDIMYKCGAYSIATPATTGTTWRICTSTGDGNFSMYDSSGVYHAIDVEAGNTYPGGQQHNILSVGNFTGDGKTSFLVNHTLHYDNGSTWDLDNYQLFSPGNASRANLLTTINNGEGGHTEIKYQPAPVFTAPDGTQTAIDQSRSLVNNPTTPTNIMVPNTSPRNLVSDVIIHAGFSTWQLASGSITRNGMGTDNDDLAGWTRYKYLGGMYYPGTMPERCALGFNWIEALDMVTHCKTRTYYSQDKSKRNQGSIISVITYGYDGVNTNGYGGVTLAKADTIYDHKDNTSLPPVTFAYKTKELFTNYNGTDVNGITYETDYSYDEYGNNTVIKNIGNITTPVTADDVETDSYFAINTTTNLMKIWKIETYGYNSYGARGLATQSIKYFDGSASAFTGTNPLVSAGNTFTGKGAVTKIVSKAGGTDSDVVTAFGYDNWGNCTTVTDARSIVTKKYYDSNYHMLVTNTTTDPTGLNLQTQYGYDTLMNNVSVTDANNVVISRTSYNTLGEPEKILGPNDTFDNPGIFMTYDHSEKTSPLDGSQNANGFKYVYSKAKPVMVGMDPVETYTYFNGIGQKLVELVKSAAGDPSGGPFRTTDYYYDAAGRLFAVSIPYGSSSAFVNYARFSLMACTKTVYDFAGRPSKTIGIDGTTVQTVYGLTFTGVIDKNGHYTQTDVSGNTKTAREYTGTASFDGLATVSGVTQYAATTTQEYRGGTKVTDANGNTTVTAVNMLGRKTRITSPDMGTWSFTYDGDGNKTQVTDAKGQIIKYTYDNCNRSKTIEYPVGTTITTYTYDQTDSLHGYGKGRLTTAQYAAGSNSYCYNNDGTLQARTVTIDSTARTESYSYFQTGKLSTETFPDGEILHFGYNLDGLLNAVWRQSDAYGYINSTNYNMRGQIVSMSKGNSRTTTYDYYDIASGNYDPSAQTRYSFRLRQESSSINGTMFDYQYDKMGNLAVKHDWVSTNPYYNSGNASYTYDEMDRLVGATVDAFGTLSYTYDKVGNITGKDGNTFSYVSGTNRLSFDGQNYYQYDANGNITFRSSNQNPITPAARIGTSNYPTLQAAYSAATTGATINATASAFSGDITPGGTTANNVTFSGGWDASFANVVGFTTLGGQIANNQKNLTFMKFILTSAGEQSGLVYNYDNMLITAGASSFAYFGEKRVKKSENGVTTRYFFDDYEEEVGSVSTNIVKYYPGGAISSSANGLVYTYKDISGNTAVVTDSSGNILKDLKYDPFGSKTLENGGTQKVKYRFASGELDAGGLNYFGARYYDPTIGRFITPDTIVPGGTPQNLNRYAYCGNNPVNFTDPSGHSWFSDTFGDLGTAISSIMDIGDYFTKPVLKFVMSPFEMAGINELHFGMWVGIGGEGSINCETGDYSGDVGAGGGVQAGGSTKYADIGGDCSTHVGLGYRSADKSLYFKASAAAGCGNNYGGNVTLGYSFKNNVGYQDANITAGPASYGWSIYGNRGDYYAGLSFGGLSGTWSSRDGFSLGASLSDKKGNSAGVSYNVKNGRWRASVSLKMCFVAGTKVETKDGEKKIEDIKAGDIVKSYNEKTGEFGYKEVLRTIVTHPDEIVQVKIGNESIECTTVHPFFVVNEKSGIMKLAVNYHESAIEPIGAWVYASDLKPGMQLLGSDGTIRKITGVSISKRSETTYNFEVAEWHTYCVGKEHIVVHNDSTSCSSWESCGKETVKQGLEGVDKTIGVPGKSGIMWMEFGYQLGKLVDGLVELASKPYDDSAIYEVTREKSTGTPIAAGRPRSGETYYVPEDFPELTITPEDLPEVPLRPEDLPLVK